jgi:transposase
MPYSNDLRRKLIAAWQQWDGTQRELAQLFGVSRSYLQKVLRRWRRTGDLDAPTYRHGPASRIAARRLTQLVAARPDATLAELGAQLRASPSAVCRRLQRLGLRLKKRSPSTPASAIARASRRCATGGAAGASGGTPGG